MHSTVGASEVGVGPVGAFNGVVKALLVYLTVGVSKVGAGTVGTFNGMCVESWFRPCWRIQL